MDSKPYLNKVFNLVSSFKVMEEKDGGLTIQGMASTAGIDRVGDVIDSEAWQKGGLNNYKKNPVILFNHDYHRPIGRAVNISSTSRGLELEAKISKAAEGGICGLIKDGVLGAFSVGFIVKDADYIEETNGLKIKDAELLEVSVVTVPCNQEATFSLAKSFDSIEEFEDFKNTFTNRVDLAGQLLANKEVNASKIASKTPGVANKLFAKKEINMDDENKVDLEAFAKKVAEETATRIAMDQAKTKAKEAETQEAARVKAEAEAVEKTALEAKHKKELEAAVTTGSEISAERLLKDFAEQLKAKDADIASVLAQFKKDLEEKNDEITKMRDSKRLFTDNGGNGNVKESISKWGAEFLNAHMLGIMTRKGFETDYAKSIMQKAGIDYVSNAPDIDQEVASRIEKEIQRELKVARLFREFQVNGAATVLPIQLDVGLADWAINATSGNLQNRTSPTTDTYQPGQVILNAYRLVSSTYMDNDVDEQVLVNLMPMLIEGVARAHARTVESTVLLGDGLSSPNIGGLDSYAATFADQIDLNATSIATGDSALMTASILLGARQTMGKYGVNPSDLAYIVSQNSYYDLLSDSNFQTLDEVGSDLAVRVTGSLGAVYGTPVIVSDEFATEASGEAAAFVVYTRNYIIPRLRGVKVETDYEVMNQRRVIVASQSLGFEEILAGAGGNEPSVKITFTA